MIEMTVEYEGRIYPKIKLEKSGLSSILLILVDDNNDEMVVGAMRRVAR